MNPSELEFIGENETLGIIPNFSMDPLHLISGSIGPFRAGLPVHGKFTSFIQPSFNFTSNSWVFSRRLLISSPLAGNTFTETTKMSACAANMDGPGPID